MLQMGDNGNHFLNILDCVRCHTMFHRKDVSLWFEKVSKKFVCNSTETHGVTWQLTVYAKPSICLYVIWLYVVHQTVQC